MLCADLTFGMTHLMFVGSGRAHGPRRNRAKTFRADADRREGIEVAHPRGKLLSKRSSRATVERDVMIPPTFNRSTIETDVSSCWNRYLRTAARRRSMAVRSSVRHAALENREPRVLPAPASASHRARNTVMDFTSRRVRLGIEREPLSMVPNDRGSPATHVLGFLIQRRAEPASGK
jgi:hypothetical protein